MSESSDLDTTNELRLGESFSIFDLIGTFSGRHIDVMKEVIIKYNDSKVLELLKSLAKLFDFSITEKEEPSGHKKKNVSFTALKIDTKGFRFNRDEANER